MNEQQRLLAERGRRLCEEEEVLKQRLGNHSAGRDAVETVLAGLRRVRRQRRELRRALQSDSIKLAILQQDQELLRREREFQALKYSHLFPGKDYRSGLEKGPSTEKENNETERLKLDEESDGELDEHEADKDKHYECEAEKGRGGPALPPEVGSITPIDLAKVTEQVQWDVELPALTSRGSKERTNLARRFQATINDLRKHRSFTERALYEPIAKFVNDILRGFGNDHLDAAVVVSSTKKRQNIIVAPSKKILAEWDWTSVVSVIEVKKVVTTAATPLTLNKAGRIALGQVLDFANSVFLHQSVTQFYGVVTDSLCWWLVRGTNGYQKLAVKGVCSQETRSLHEYALKLATSREVFRMLLFWHQQYKLKASTQVTDKQRPPPTTMSLLHNHQSIRKKEDGRDNRDNGNGKNNPYRLVAPLIQFMDGPSIYLATMHGREDMVVAKRQNHASNTRNQVSREADVLKHLRVVLKETKYLPKLEGFWMENNICTLLTSPVGQGTLQELIQRGPLSPPLLHLLATNISEALEQLHSCQLVMRDLHPDNIIFISRQKPPFSSSTTSSSSSSSATKEFRLIDLGLVGSPSSPREREMNGWDGSFGVAWTLSVRTLQRGCFDEQSDWVSLLYILLLAASGKELPWHNTPRLALESGILKRQQVIQYYHPLRAGAVHVKHVLSTLIRLDRARRVPREKARVIMTSLHQNLARAALEKKTKTN